MRLPKCLELIRDDDNNFYLVQHIGRDEKFNMKYFNVKCVFKSPISKRGEYARAFDFEFRRKQFVVTDIEEMKRTKAALQILYAKSSP